MSQVHGEAAKESGGHLWISRQLLPEFLRQIVKNYGGGRERIEAANCLFSLVDAHEAIGNVAAAFLPGLLLEEAVERFDAARKSRPVMLGAEGLDSVGNETGHFAARESK